MNIVSFMIHSALCILPLVAITIIVAYVTTRAKWKSAKSILADVKSGVYDEQMNPSFHKKLRAYVVISSILVAPVICLIIGLIAYDLLPFLQQQFNVNGITAFMPGLIIALVILSLILLVGYEGIMRGRKK
jgi:hypothetical protein